MNTHTSLRQHGPLAFALLAILAVALACGGGTAATQQPGTPTPAGGRTQAPTVPTPSPAPSAVASPGPSTGGSGQIASADAAIAAVVARFPAYAGYRPLIESPLPGASPHPVIGPRPGIGGGAHTVSVSGPDAAGWHVTFATGTGDCQAGCIDTRFDTFLVTIDGDVSLECSTGSPPGIGSPTPCTSS